MNHPTTVSFFQRLSSKHILLQPHVIPTYWLLIANEKSDVFIRFIFHYIIFRIQKPANARVISGAISKSIFTMVKACENTLGTRTRLSLLMFCRPTNPHIGVHASGQGKPGGGWKRLFLGKVRENQGIFFQNVLNLQQFD